MFRHVLAGAGGWGDPLERDPAAVLKDVRNELLSAAKAEADYGVVVDTARWTVDAAATAQRRAEIRARARLARGAEGAVARSVPTSGQPRYEPRNERRYRVGVDIGGTFTDIVLLGADGTIHTKKISSSVDNYARAIVDGLAELFAETGLAGGAIEEIRHGTTVASNAILEHKGARIGLITTKGFRDVLEIRTLRMPRLYDLAWRSRRRWSSATCARWSTSGSTPTAASSAPLDRAMPSARSTRCSPRRSRRSRSACSTPSPIRRTS